MLSISEFVAWAVARMSTVFDTQEYENVSMVIGGIIALSF